MKPWDMTTPRKAIHELAQTAALNPMVSANRRTTLGGPGGYIGRLPEDVRAVLRELRSEDVADVAPHVIAWMCGVG